MSKIQIIPGPLVSQVSKEEAERGLTSHPQFVKGSSYVLDKVEGTWVAAVMQAGPPFGEPGEAAPEGPPTEDAPFEPPSDGAAEPEDKKDDDSPSDDKPKGDKDDKGGEKGLEAKVDHLVDQLTKIVDALGLGDLADGPVPGEEVGPPDPGAGAPPFPPEGGGGDGKTHTVHERALKPGEAPPGTTPVGAPAFASVRDDHPWRDMISEAASFHVDDEIGDATPAQAAGELRSLAGEIGYKLRQFRPYDKGGKKFAKAFISKY